MSRNLKVQRLRPLTKLGVNNVQHPKARSWSTYQEPALLWCEIAALILIAAAAITGAISGR